MTKTLRFPVFQDDKGNRFVFPGYYVDESRPVDWFYSRRICASLGVTEEKAPLDVVEENGMLNLPHVEAMAGSYGFAHGSNPVWLIGGPEFEKIKAEDESRT